MRGRKYWKAICSLPRYSFLKDMRENVCAVENKSGNWIEVHKAQEIVDNAETDIQELIEALNMMVTYFGMDEDEWSKAIFDNARNVLKEKK